MVLTDSSGTVLHHPRIYIDWWGWGSPPNDPNGEMQKWRDFLENLGGSKWLATVEQYYDNTGQYAGNPSDLFTGAEWRDQTNPLPAGYPSREQFIAETNAAIDHFQQPPDDAIILIALPPSILDPGYMRHDHTARTGAHNDAVWIEAAYSANATRLIEHEVAESITDPMYPEHKAWQGGCHCEIADRCAPPSFGSTPGSLTVGESPTADYTVPALWSNDRNPDGAGDACVISHPNHEDYYFVDSTGSLEWIPYFGGGVYDLGHLSGYPLKTGGYYVWGPGAAAWGRGHEDVFAIGTVGNVAHYHMDLWPPTSAGWDSAWGRPSNNSIPYSPDAFSFRPGRVDVVVVGQDVNTGARSIYHRHLKNGTLYGWDNWGAPSGISIDSRPTTASEEVYWADVFFVSHSEDPPHVWHGYTSNVDGAGIQGWNDWGHPPSSGNVVTVDAASRGAHRIEVFALTTDGTMWHDWYDHGTRYGWESWGNPGYTLAMGVGAVDRGDGYVDVASGLSPTLDHKYWNKGQSSWLAQSSVYEYTRPDMDSW